jgi:hypothetical protein
MNYRYVGGHAIVTESGAPLGPGDFIELSDEDAQSPYNTTLIEEGRLIEADTQTKSSKSKKEEG